MGYKILFSNVGYAKGIDGTLWQHVSRFHRHFYCSVPLQQEVLNQLRNIIGENKPDLCCFVELDEGSAHSARFNQFDFLREKDYSCHEIADKYGPNSWIGRMPLHIGKGNAFMAREKLVFKRLYFRNGSKRLIHEITLPRDVKLYFTHFSLNHGTRMKQLKEMNTIVREEKNPVIIMADFNILRGFKELSPLLDGTDLKVLNKETDHTFMLHHRKHTLDLCICSEQLASKMSLQIIPQPFSDHAAILAEGEW